jgi:hypothetical protein
MQIFESGGRYFVERFHPDTGKRLPEAQLPEFATEEQAKAWVKWKRTGKHRGKHPEYARRGRKSRGVKRPNRKGRSNDK